MSTEPYSAAFYFVLPTPDPVVDAVLQRPVQTFDPHGQSAQTRLACSTCVRAGPLSPHRQEKLRVHVSAQSLVAPRTPRTAHAGIAAAAAMPREEALEGSWRVSKLVIRA